MTQTQTTLPEVIEQKIEVSPRSRFLTLHFEVHATSDLIEKLIEKTNKKSESGMSIYDDKEKKAIKMLFIQKRMRCISVKPIFGNEWLESSLALYHKIFREEYE